MTLLPIAPQKDRRSPIRGLVCVAIWLGIAALATGQAKAQQVMLSMSSESTTPGTSVALTVSMTTSGGALPAGLQWTFILQPGLDIVSVEAGKAAKEAGKTLVCSGPKCIVYGLNLTRISNGPVAVLKIKVDGSLTQEERSALVKQPANGRARTGTAKIRLADMIAVSLEGNGIPVVAGESLISTSKMP